MEQPNTQAVTNYRDNVLAKAKERYPERNFAGQVGQDGQTGTDDLDQAVSEYLDELISERDANSKASEQLKNLLYSDPRSAEFMNKWVQSGDPRVALVETFGDDLADLATEEGRGQFSESLQGWRDAKAQTDNLNAEAESNWDESLNKCQAWGESKGLSQDQLSEIMIRLVNRTAEGLMNKYTEEDFEAEYKALNYDNDVETARRDGEVAGRNAKIAAQTRERNAANTPVISGGQGMRVAEKQPARENNNPWAGIQ